MIFWAVFDPGIKAVPLNCIIDAVAVADDTIAIVSIVLLAIELLFLIIPQ